MENICLLFFYFFDTLIFVNSEDQAFLARTQEEEGIQRQKLFDSHFDIR